MAPSELLVAAIEDARTQGSSTAKAIFEALRATNEWTDVTESAVRKALTRAKALAPALSLQERVLQRKQKERERDRLRNRTGRARPSEDVKRQTTEQKRTDSAARAWARKQRAIEKKQTGIADSYCDAGRLYAAELRVQQPRICERDIRASWKTGSTPRWREVSHFTVSHSTGRACMYLTI